MNYFLNIGLVKFVLLCEWLNCIVYLLELFVFGKFMIIKVKFVSGFDLIDKGFRVFLFVCFEILKYYWSWGLFEWLIEL